MSSQTINEIILQSRTWREIRTPEEANCSDNVN